MANPNDLIYRYQPLFGSWNVEEEIGEGSFGIVYRVSKEQLGQKYISAVKLITIPSKEQYREAKSTLGTDANTLHNYFQDIVENIIKEVNILHSLSGNINILNYHDHNVVERVDEIGWDILIRMEYVSSLPTYLETHSINREQVLKLGIDICTALEICSKKGIIHRDIKDENIFVNGDEIFKLGDFGIARELSGSGRAASMRGTPLYMAPEVYRGEKYDPSVDIYSLGIVLYKLLNNGRMPFMPPFSKAIKYKDSEEALDKRMLGEALPLPISSGKALGSVVLKACAFKANDRYSTAVEMRKALEDVLAAFSQEEREFAVIQPLCIQNTHLSKQEEQQNEMFESVGIFADLEDVAVIPPTEKFQMNKTMSMFSGLRDSTAGETDKFLSEVIDNRESISQQSINQLPIHICKRCGIKNRTKFCSGCGMLQEENNGETEKRVSSSTNYSYGPFNKMSIGLEKQQKKSAKKYFETSLYHSITEVWDNIIAQRILAVVNIIIGLIGMTSIFLRSAFSNFYNGKLYFGGSVFVQNMKIYQFGGKGSGFYFGLTILVLGVFARKYISRTKLDMSEIEAQRKFKVAKMLNLIALVLAINIVIIAFSFLSIFVKFNSYW